MFGNRIETHANTVCKCFLRSVRTECLDHVLVSGEAHLGATVRRYCAYSNTARPHQGIRQRVPDGPHRRRPTARSKRSLFSAAFTTRFALRRSAEGASGQYGQRPPVRAVGQVDVGADWDDTPMRARSQPRSATAGGHFAPTHVCSARTPEGESCHGHGRR